MPVVRVEWPEGRSAEEKRETANFIADTIAEADHIGKERVMVMFTDYPKDSISRGGRFADD
jgi:phenylpyruvate tautomerase PptA (4-oxalocrotonate tautomerase family)